MKVYTLEDGEYSDYHIEAMFSTKKKAEEYQVWRNSHTTRGSGRIEIWNVDNPGEWFKKGYGCYEVTFEKLTSVVKSIEFDDDIYFEKGYMGYHKDYTVNVWARDKKHAVKIANEKRAQHIALGKS